MKRSSPLYMSTVFQFKSDRVNLELIGVILYRSGMNLSFIFLNSN